MISLTLSRIKMILTTFTFYREEENTIKLVIDE